jgi:hypothetical protein
VAGRHGLSAIARPPKLIGLNGADHLVQHWHTLAPNEWRPNYGCVERAWDIGFADQTFGLCLR